MATKGSTGFTNQQQAALYRARRRRLEVLGGGGQTPAAPVNTSLPTISGTPTQGQTLTGAIGTWTGYPLTNPTFEWRRVTGNVLVSTAGAYVLQATDVGSTITFSVKYTNATAPAGVTATSLPTSAVISAPIPVNTGLPTISNPNGPYVGQTVTRIPGTWTNSPTSYLVQWLRGGATIPGGTNDTYVLTVADQGALITVSVIAINASGQSLPAVSNPGIGPVIGIPVNTAIPTISGTLVAGEVLTGTQGTWNNASTFIYQWRADGSPIPGASALTYTLTAGEVNKAITFGVQANNLAGGANAVSVPTTPVLAAYPFTTPLLTWPGADPTTDNTPDLTATFYESIIGHNIRLVGSQIAGSVPPYSVDTTNNIDAAEDAAQLALFATGPLALGLTYMRCRIESSVGAIESLWSNVVSHTIISATSPEYQQWLNRAQAYDSNHNLAYSGLIDGLVADGLWNKLDCFYIFATDTPFNAKLNLKSASFALIETGTAPTFTADRGYLGNGGYFRTGYIPSTAGGALSLNSATIGTYNRANHTTDTNQVVMGSGGSPANAVLAYLPKNTGGAIFYINDNTSSNFTQANALGINIGTRNSSGNTSFYKDGALVGTLAATTTAMPAIELYIMAQNNNGVPQQTIGDQQAAVFIGSGLNATEAANLTTRIRNYMNIVGA